MIKGKVIGKEIDENGNIKVKTEYTLTNGKKVIGHTRYNFLTFSGEMILKDVEAHCATLMKRIWALKKHQELIQIDLSGIFCDLSQVEIIIKPAVKDAAGNIVTPAEKIMIDDK